MNRKTIALAAMSILMAMAMLLSGCGSNDNDTRQYIRTFGVVVTNDLDVVFTEMFIYPSDDIARNRGDNIIQDMHDTPTVGSYGVTLERETSYNIVVRDNRGRVYEFQNVALQNADEVVLTYEDELMAVVYHRGGGSESVTGEYVAPGDAPDYVYTPPRKREAYEFTIQNQTNATIAFITMREEKDPDKGEVILNAELLAPDKSVKVSGRLYEEDKEITDWILHIETDEGESYDFKAPFDPWTTNTITITFDGTDFQFAAT